MDNEQLTTYSIEDITNKIESEWRSDKNTKLKNLSKLLDDELIEFIPSNLKDDLMPIPKDADERHRFYLKTYKGDEGKKYQVACNNKIFKSTKKLPKRDKNECLDILQSLSNEPTGSLLPKQNKLKQVRSSGGIQHKLADKYNLKNFDGSIPTFYQYRCCGTRKQYRLIWVVDKSDKVVKIVFFGKRSKLDIYN